MFLLTLYPWLIPLMNCWGGGFQRNWMVVEFTASTCTFWGGAVGTAPGWQGSKTERRRDGGTKEKSDSLPLASHKVITTLRKGCTSCERVPSNDLERRVIGLISHSASEILSRGWNDCCSLLFHRWVSHKGLRQKLGNDRWTHLFQLSMTAQRLNSFRKKFLVSFNTVQFPRSDKQTWGLHS